MVCQVVPFLGLRHCAEGFLKYIIRPEHQFKLEVASAQLGRRILAHASTFGENWNVKYGKSFGLF